MDSTKEKITQEIQPNLKDAVQVAEQVQLKEVRLLGCDCNQNIKNIQGDKCFDIERNIEVQVDKEAGRIFVIAAFDLKAFLENEKDDPFAKIKATFLLIYEAEDILELPNEYFDSFAKMNGVYNAWPYWREFVQNATTRMGIPSLTIPVFRIVKPAEKELPQKKSVSKKTTKKISSKTLDKKKSSKVNK